MFLSDGRIWGGGESRACIVSIKYYWKHSSNGILYMFGGLFVNMGYFSPPVHVLTYELINLLLNDDIDFSPRAYIFNKNVCNRAR